MSHMHRRTIPALLLLAALLLTLAAAPARAIVLLPGTPGLREVTRYDTSGLAYDVAVANSTAYVAAGQAGLQLIDLNDPALPIPPGSLDTPGLAYALQLVGSRAYIANRVSPVGQPLEYGSLDIIDVSDAHAPKLLGRYRPDLGGDVWDVEVLDNLAYIIEHVGTDPNYFDAQLTILNVADPASPSVVSSTPIGGFFPRVVSLAVGSGRAVVGSTKYIYHSNYSALDVYDVSNPSAPTHLDEFRPEALSLDLLNVGTTLYSGGFRLQRYDLSNLAQPTLLSPDVFFGVDVAGALVYAAGYSWQGTIVTIIDVSGSPRPAGTAVLPDVDEIHRLQAASERVYVAAGADGLIVLERVSLPQQRFLPRVG